MHRHHHHGINDGRLIRSIIKQFPWKHIEGGSQQENEIEGIREVQGEIKKNTSKKRKHNIKDNNMEAKPKDIIPVFLFLIESNNHSNSKRQIAIDNAWFKNDICYQIKKSHTIFIIQYYAKVLIFHVFGTNL